VSLTESIIINCIVSLHQTLHLDLVLVMSGQTTSMMTQALCLLGSYTSIAEVETLLTSSSESTLL